MPGRIFAQYEEGKEGSSSASEDFYRGDRESRSVALTFDDGPNARYTPPLVELLRQEGVTATFFLLGEQVEQFSSVALMIHELGFEVGNHSFGHPKLTSRSEEKIHDEIERTQEEIEKATGVKPKVFRPPYGLVNDRVRRICQENGLKLVMWSVDSNDWRDGMTREKIVSKILKEAEGGSIILMHDRLDRTMQALPEIIQGLRERGFKFVTVSELMAEEKQLVKERTERRKTEKETPLVVLEEGSSGASEGRGLQMAPPVKRSIEMKEIPLVE